jgi:hypothetical protein
MDDFRFEARLPANKLLEKLSLLHDDPLITILILKLRTILTLEKPFPADKSELLSLLSQTLIHPSLTLDVVALFRPLLPELVARAVHPQSPEIHNDAHLSKKRKISENCAESTVCSLLLYSFYHDLIVLTCSALIIGENVILNNDVRGVLL